MTRRVLSLILALVLVIGMFPVSARAAESIELTVWAAEGDLGWLESRLDAFEAANPQWNITWNTGVCYAGDAPYLVANDPAAAADVYFFSSDSLYTLVDAEALLPLNGTDVEETLTFTPRNLMNTVMDASGTYYGYPVSSNTWFMYYDKRVFSEADVKSLEAMLSRGKVAFSITNSWHLPAFYFANGCTLFGPDGNDAAAGVDFGGKKAIDTTLRLVELVEHPNFCVDTEYGPWDMGDGTINAYFSGTWDYPALLELLGDDLGAVAPPTVQIDGADKQLRPYLSSQAIGVNGYTRHETAARALARFLSNEESQLLRWKDGIHAVPAAATLANDPSIASDPSAKAQIETSLHAVVQPCIAEMNGLWGPIGTFGYDLANGNITAENAAEMTEQLNGKLNDSYYIPPVEEEEEDGFLYEVRGDHVAITGYTGTPEVLAIPAEIEGLPVTVIDGFAFYFCESLTEITLPDTVTFIDEFAFSCCDNLTSITLPDRLEAIGGSAFEYCISLTGITIPSNVTAIGPSCFSGCSSLTSIRIPASVTDIEYQAFAYCGSLTAIEVDAANPNYCSWDGALYDRDMYRLICCPGGWEGSFTIPASVHVLYYAFEGCHKLTDLQVEAGSSKFASSDGILYNMDMTELIRCPGGKSGHAVIPGTVKQIDSYAFADCANLTGVTLPGSITEILTGTFYNCTGLTGMTIPNGVTAIGDEAFFGCCGLVSIVIPDGVTSIGSDAFFDCENLTDITLPDSLDSIGFDAFSDCYSLTNIEIPGSVTYIGDYAFWVCENLRSIYFNGDAPFFGEDVFVAVTATAYYPSGNPTWTEDVMQDYGGDITWVPYNPNNPFLDVPVGAFYEAPVLWAVENGITAGASANSFNPGGSCLRAQVVTFLWRAEGQPEPAIATSRFTDVKPTDFFFKPVLWAVEQIITSGVSATQFGSYANCNRAAVVTFLWRAAGSPEPSSTNNPFTDVKSTDFFYKPVLWAVENGITAGLTATTFGPTAECNRAQVVTFLYRAYN